MDLKNHFEHYIYENAIGRKYYFMNIKYWVIDIDGTMTDGGLYYDESGNEIKKFCTKDAAAFFAVHECGMKIVVLTGRKSNATERRMKELKVDYLYQGILNKEKFLARFVEDNNIPRNQLAYIGDDLNDYAAMKLCGFVACPKDSCKEIKKISQYISNKKGGHGAVRDIIEYVLGKENLWDSVIQNVYKIGI